MAKSDEPKAIILTIIFVQIIHQTERKQTRPLKNCCIHILQSYDNDLRTGICEILDLIGKQQLRVVAHTLDIPENTIRLWYKNRQQYLRSRQVLRMREDSKEQWVFELLPDMQQTIVIPKKRNEIVYTAMVSR